MSKEKKTFVIASGIFKPDIGGPASYANTIAEKLSATRPVKVVTYSSVGRFREDKERPFKVIRVWNKIPKFFRWCVYSLKLFNATDDANIILALNALSAGIPAYYSSRIRKCKFYIKIVGDYAWEMAILKGKTSLMINDFQKSKKSGVVGFLHRMQVKICRHADGVIVPSEYLANIVTGWGVPREKIKIIYNGVGVQPLDISKEEARRTVGITGNIILSSGRLVMWKGFRMLIKIMPQVLQINQFIRLVIVGDGPERRRLELMVRNMGLEKKVYIVGRKTPAELAQYMAAADMFVLNTGYEGFSHQILEAMAFGVPIVTTTAGGNREVIRQGENGFMVKYNDEFNLIEAIRTLWNNPELREEFIVKGKETVRHFTPTRMIEETLTFFGERNHG